MIILGVVLRVCQVDDEPKPWQFADNIARCVSDVHEKKRCFRKALNWQIEERNSFTFQDLEDVDKGATGERMEREI